VTWSVDNQESWKFEIDIDSSTSLSDMAFDIIFWEVSGTNLLSNTTSFTSLNVGSSELIKDKSLTSIDVTKNTDNWASKFGNLGFDIGSSFSLSLQDFFSSLFHSLLFGLVR